MRLACALLALAIAGCAVQPALPRSATLPEAARAAPGQYLVLTVRNSLAPTPLQAASTPHGYGGGQYIAGSAARTLGRAVARDYGLVEVASWPIQALGLDCLVYGIPAGADLAGLVASLGRDPRVDSAQPLQSFGTLAEAYNDPYAGLQQNMTQMAIAAAQPMGRGGAGVRVAIIDTGADTSHPDFPVGALLGRNFVDTDGGAFRRDAHGTAVAGVIGAIPNNGLGIVGVAPRVELLVYKACWQSTVAGAASVCNSFTLAQALAAALDAHADVINLSLGGPSDPLLTRLVQRSQAAGAIVVGAMPRDGLRRGFPVELPGVLAVEAAETAGTASGALPAPGHDILSLAPEGHYDFYSGNSLAAAEITGIVALLRSAHPQLTASEAGRLLGESATGRATGANACAALAALLHRTSCAP